MSEENRQFASFKPYFGTDGDGGTSDPFSFVHETSSLVPQSKEYSTSVFPSVVQPIQTPLSPSTGRPPLIDLPLASRMSVHPTSHQVSGDPTSHQVSGPPSLSSPTGGNIQDSNNREYPGPSPTEGKGLVPSPTSAFAPYPIPTSKEPSVVSSLLDDPPSTMFSSVSILTPSPAISPVKKDQPALSIPESHHHTPLATVTASNMEKSPVVTPIENKGISHDDQLKATSITQSGPPTAPITQSGPPTAPITQSGPPTAPITQSGPPTAPITQSGPPTAPITQSGPPTAPITQSGPPTAPITQSGPLTAPITQSGPPTAPITQSGPPTAPITQSGPPTAPITQSGPPTASITQSGPLTAPITQSGPLTAPITQSGPPTAPITQSGPPTASITQSGPLTAPITQSGPLTAPITQSGPPTAPITQSGPPTAPITQSGPPTAPITQSGPLTAPITQSGPLTAPITQSGPPDPSPLSMQTRYQEQTVGGFSSISSHPITTDPISHSDATPRGQRGPEAHDHPSSSSRPHDPPSSKPYDPLSSRPYDPPSSKPYDPPRPYDPPSSRPYDPPSSTPYDPPSSRPYDPSSSGHNIPPSSRSYNQYSAPTETSSKEYNSSSRQYNPSSNQDDPPSTRYDPPSNRYDPPSRQYDQSSRQYDPPSRQYDPPSKQYDQPSRQYDQSSRLYDPPSRQYDEPSRQYDQPSRQYDETSRQYDPPSRQYDPPSRQYNPSSRQYDPSSRQYDSSSRQYDPSSRQYDPSSRQYDPSSRQYDPSSRQYNPPSRQYDPSSRQYDPSSRQYDPPSQQYDPSSRQYDHPPRQYDSSVVRYDDSYQSVDDLDRSHPTIRSHNVTSRHVGSEQRRQEADRRSYRASRRGYRHDDSHYDYDRYYEEYKRYAEWYWQQASVYGGNWQDPYGMYGYHGYPDDSNILDPSYLEDEQSTISGQWPGGHGETPGDYSGVDTEQWVESTVGQVVEPARETPLLFGCPHAPVRFGVGGTLVVVTPTSPSEYSNATVQLIQLKDVVPEYKHFTDDLVSHLGPLIPGETPKSEVVRFATDQADQCKKVCQGAESSEVAEHWREKALLWEYLVLLCQQNGVIVPSDISELLTKGHQLTPAMFDLAPPTARPYSEVQHEFRMLILSGRKKDALNFACHHALWGHALMLASTMEEQSHHYVVNRFTASLLSSDPLNTFYTLVLGRMPTVTKPDGLARGGDWKPHLSVILSNGNSSSQSATLSLGDSLMSKGHLFGAHFCYKMADVEFEGYGCPVSRYSLLGVGPQEIQFGGFPTLDQLAMTLVYEYAMTLGKESFNIPLFQTFKFLHVIQLIQTGQCEQALKYCELMSLAVFKSPQQVNRCVRYQLLELSARIYNYCRGGGVVSSNLPSWIINLSLYQSQDDHYSQDDLKPPILATGDEEGSMTAQTSGDPVQVGGVPTTKIGEIPTTQMGGVPTALLGVAGVEGVDSGNLASSSQVSVQSSLSQHPPVQSDHVTEGDGGTQTESSSVPLMQPSYGQGQFGSETVQQFGSETVQQFGSENVPQHQEQQAEQSNVQQYGFGDLQQYGTGNVQQYGTGTVQQYGTGDLQQYGTGDVQQYGIEGQQNAYNYSTNDTSQQYGLGSVQQHGSGDVQSYGFQPGSRVDQPLYVPQDSSLPQPSSTQVKEAGDPQPKEVDVKDDDVDKGEDEKRTASKKEPNKGFGIGSIFRSIFPGRKNEVHLPPDKSKSIVWDEKEKKWINTNPDEDEPDAPPPPPTDHELMAKFQQPPSNVGPGPTGGLGTLGGPLSTGGPVSTGGPGPTGGPVSTGGLGPTGGPGVAQVNRFSSRNRSSRSKYIDVLGGKKTTGEPLAPPPPMMSLGPQQQYTGSFFVPSVSSTEQETHLGQS